MMNLFDKAKKEVKEKPSEHVQWAMIATQIIAGSALIVISLLTSSVVYIAFQIPKELRENQSEIKSIKLILTNQLEVLKEKVDDAVEKNESINLRQQQDIDMLKRLNRVFN